MNIIFDPQVARQLFAQTGHPLAVLAQDGQLGVSQSPLQVLPAQARLLAVLPALTAADFGDASFRRDYQCRYAYMTGAMANGIASAELVIAMGRAGLLASYGAGGVLPEQVARDVGQIRQALSNQPFAVNLIHAPHEALMEQRCVDILLSQGVNVLEASAFMELTAPLIQFRLSGVYRTDDGHVRSRHRVIAKISRPEVAKRFMAAAPQVLVDALVKAGKISQAQAALAPFLPVADDITVEADSGGHTDRRPLVSLLPLILRLRDQLAQQYGFSQSIRIGAAGGIATPEAAYAAFAMGAAYVVTGSINQSCLESGSSPHVRALLGKAGIADIEMAPAADMFELGVQLQVLKVGTLFPMRAKQLYQLYQNYPSLEAIPEQIRQKLEQQLFTKSLAEVWSETCAYFKQRDPEQIQRALADPKRRMALVFRSYLGQSSMWANQGVAGREMDYQIWAGPAMGAFNDWVMGSYLQEVSHRRVVDVAEHLMRACALHNRVHLARLQQLAIPQAWQQYQILPLTAGKQNAA
jgi:PfaD family protein